MPEDMDHRKRLSKYVGSGGLSRNERETTIQFFGDAHTFEIITYSETIARKILEHDCAEIQWVYAEVGGNRRKRIADLSSIRPAEDTARIEGVAASLPLGALTIKGSPRNRDRQSAIVTTPTESKQAAEAFNNAD
ncbi:hypothetical protein ACFQH6_03745 [Halobacteriaceae archaeon GCM10025711]